MWKAKTFRTRDEMAKWLKRRAGRIQFEEIAVNNAWGVLWRPLRLIRV